MSRIVIAGGSGFLGKALARHWAKMNHQVTVLSRSPKPRVAYTEIHWDAKTKGDWQHAIDDCDVLVNMAGKSVDCRYTPQNRDEILHSRLDSTRVLQEAVDDCKKGPKIWLNASSATIYRHAEDRPMTEDEGEIGQDFSMDVVKAWEAEFFKQDEGSVRKVALRTSIVLGQRGGAFPKMVQVSKLGLGGPQGKGTQLVSWIHILDFCRALDHIIYEDEISGAINITAPCPIANREFNEALRITLDVPLGLRAPAWLLEIGAFFMGTETELLLKSRWVLPEKLLASGFEFMFPEAQQAFTNLLKHE